MPVLPPGQLSKHATKGYRLSCGWYMKEGRKTPKVFWLGKDKARALRDAAKFKASVWVANFMGGWTKEYEQQVRSWDTEALVQKHFVDAEIYRQRYTPDIPAPVVAAPPTQTSPAPSSPPKPAPANAVKPLCGPTLYAAIDAFMTAFQTKRLSDSHKCRAEQVLRRNLKEARPDCALAEIDFAWLDSLADYFKSRPIGLKRKGQARTPIRPQTVKVILQYLRQFFIWLDDTSYGGWQGPRNMSKPFRIRIDELLTSVERRRNRQIQQFDVATLKALYAAASDFQKCIMLTSLFTGGTQQELAVLEKEEFDLDSGMLIHYRNKTRVEGQYWLPPELVALLRQQFAAHPRQPLAFYTMAGRPLVSYKNGKLASDAVRQSWDDLRIAAEIPDALSFKYLRKFLADWMTRHGGEGMGQIALSHAQQSILAKHYTSVRDFAGFHELQVKMYAELQAAGMFSAGSIGPSA